MTERPRSGRSLEARLPEHEEPVTLGELCRLCGVHAELVHEMVLEGFLEPIEPLDPDHGRLRFPPDAVIRVRRGLRLQRDLGVNLAGVALAVDLLEELEDARRRLRLFEELFLPPENAERR